MAMVLNGVTTEVTVVRLTDTETAKEPVDVWVRPVARFQIYYV